MSSEQIVESHSRLRRSILMLLPLVFGTFQLCLQAQEHDMHSMHDGMSMPMDAPLDPTHQAKLLADKRESEFNHHLAGFFVVLAAAFILAESSLRARWPFVIYAWPVCFLLSGIFLLVWSDTELWPFGPYHWWNTLKTNGEVLQHKTFAVILLALGVIEVQRARGALKSLWAAWIFPALAVVGSCMLLIHEHHSGMSGPDHMALMARIQSEHLSFALAGFGIGLSKGFAETRNSWQPFFQRLWPSLMMVLGALLMVYVE
jgi:putative copper resistance protein D